MSRKACSTFGLELRPRQWSHSMPQRAIIQSGDNLEEESLRVSGRKPNPEKWQPVDFWLRNKCEGHNLFSQDFRKR